MTKYTLILDTVRDFPIAYVRDEEGNRIADIEVPADWWDDMPPDEEVRKLARQQCQVLRGKQFAIKSPC